MGRDISCLKGKRIDGMRRIPVAVIVLVSSVSVFNLGTPARAASDPVCLTGGSDKALRCEFANFEECRATASGGFGYFVRNPTSLSIAHPTYARSLRPTFYPPSPASSTRPHT